jgi:O-antigen ligase
MTWLFIALAGLYLIARLWPWLGNYLLPLDTYWTWRDDIGRFQRGSDGSLFWVWLVALSFSQAAFNSRLSKGWRLMIGGVGLLSLYVALFPGREWVSGYLPALFALVTVLWVAAPRLGLLATLVGGMAAAFKAQGLFNAVMVGDNQYSLMSRQEAWGLVLEISKVNPLFGLGPANYHYYTPIFPIHGYYVRFNSHSQYIDLVAQTGVLGLLCFLSFFAVVGWLGWRLRSRVPDGFARAYVYGALGGLVGTLVSAALGDWVIPFTYNIGLTGFRASFFGWLFLGGLLALEQITRKSSDTHQETDL